MILIYGWFKGFNLYIRMLVGLKRIELMFGLWVCCRIECLLFFSSADFWLVGQDSENPDQLVDRLGYTDRPIHMLQPADRLFCVMVDWLVNPIDRLTLQWQLIRFVRFNQFELCSEWIEWINSTLLLWFGL